MQYEMKDLREMLDKNSFHALRAALSGMNEVDVAQFMETLPEQGAALVFRMLDRDKASDVFSELEGGTQQLLVKAFSDQEVTALVEDLAVDDAVDLLEDMPANVVKRILQSATPDTRGLINQFLKYPADSAGSIMTAEFTDLRAGMTVGQAIAHIRATGEDRETVYTCYVISTHRRLLGVVSVRSLLLARDTDLVQDLMERDVIRVTTDTDQEQTARLLNRYSLLSIPVVDKEERLVGIVTVDDATDILEEEATEDFERMAALAPSEKPYLKTGVFELARHRMVWLLVLMVSGMVTGGILGRYEAAFSAIPLLVTFIPMLTDTGGNAGSQSSTLVIRGLALGEVRPADFLAVLWKELRVSLLVGVVLAAVNYVRLVLMYPGSQTMALTVALTLVCTVMTAKTIGGVLPLAAKKLNLDPAIMASPLITTIVDAVSLVIYFGIAQQLLPI